MKLYNVLFNNKIPFILLENDDPYNVIYCNKFEDHLFNIGTFGTKTKEIMLEYKEEENDKFVVVDVTFEDGKCYEGVLFKIVIAPDKETPHSTFNPELLVSHSISKVEFIDEKEESPSVLIESDYIEPVIEESFRQLEERKRQYEELVEDAKLREENLIKEKQDIAKQKLLLENQNTIKAKLDEYKKELLEEYVDAIYKQKELLQTKIKDDLLSAELELNERITNTFKDYDILLEDFKTTSKKEQLDFILIKIDESIVSIQKELNDLIDNKFKIENEQVLDILQAKSALLSEKYEQKLLLELEKYKESLFEEFYSKSEERISNILTDKKEIVEQQIIEVFLEKEKQFTKDFSTQFKNTTEEIESIIQEFVDKLPTINDNILLLDNKVKNLIKEKNKFEESGNFNTTQQKYIADTAQYWARRILDLGGGGGSVAVQYAEGGIMNGDLTVNGKIIAESLTINDDITICGDIFPCQTDTYNLGSSAFRWKDLHLAGNSLYLGDSVITAIGTTIVVPDQEVDGSIVVLDGDVSVSSGNYLSGGINLLDIFGSSQSITVIAGNSARWDSTYTTVNTYSGSWVTFPYVESNYLNLTGGRINGNLTVTGNLTALGTSSFVNTIFTTTSALSVVNLGHGPALYVFQAAGPYDVASFYDGDGIEVLHVGNASAGGLGKIGINESYPQVELTVNGSISGNRVIIVDGGNSKDWNAVYSSVNQISGDWNSVYTSVNDNSGLWDSVYNSWYSTSSIYVTTHYLSTNNVLLSSATVTDNINVGGTGFFRHIAAASKSFYIPHPSKPNMHLQYGSLESPYHGVRLTGRSSVKKLTKIQLPSYIRDLVKQNNVNVQLTNINHTHSLYVSEINVQENYFVVKRNSNILNRHKEYEFFWTFTAIRKDIPDLEVEMS